MIGKVANEKGKLVWPMETDLIVSQLLATSTRPLAIPKNIGIQAKTFHAHAVIKESPSACCVRRCRGKMRICEEMISACRLAKAQR